VLAVRGLSLQGITILESMGSSDSIELPGSDSKACHGRTLGVDEMLELAKKMTWL
jgi:hypothetical protein